MVAVVERVRELPSFAVAVMVQDVGARGAVKSPATGSMLPQVVAQPALMLDVNCLVAPAVTLGLSGEIVNVARAATVS